ncbi:hypothetical protein AX15_000540 [Amanita polypyramis BW_CC]|nr:hypothetical protein AX15_000540 [Amanita polypyramis BW_CC]
MNSRLGSPDRRCNDTDSGVPGRSMNLQDTDHSQSESAPSNSTGSSSDEHSSNSPKASFSVPASPQPKHFSRSHSFYNSTLQDSFSSSEFSRPVPEQPFGLPPPSRSRLLKKHSPLNPASLPDLPPKLRIKPGVKPLTLQHYRTGWPSYVSSDSSGSRRNFQVQGEESVLFPNCQFHAPRSSTPSTSGESSLTLVSDTKYATALFSQGRGFIPFPFDLSLIDNDCGDDDEGMTSNPNEKVMEVGNYSVPWRGLGNVIALALMVCAILALFIIYPVCSFYHYSCEVADRLDIAIVNTTASVNASDTNGQQEGVNLNARGQIPLPATPSSPLTIKVADGVEYDLTFAEEWETEGRRFMQGQDHLWVSLDSHSNATTANGYLLLNSHARLQTRISHCLEYGIVEVDFVREEVHWTAYWTGNYWTFVRKGDPFGVRGGQSLQQMLLVTLQIDYGYDGGHPSSTTPPIFIDYIRFYSLKTRPRLLSCEDASPTHVSLRLP